MKKKTISPFYDEPWFRYSWNRTTTKTKCKQEIATEVYALTNASSTNKVNKRMEKDLEMLFWSFFFFYFGFSSHEYRLKLFWLFIVVALSFINIYIWIWIWTLWFVNVMAALWYSNTGHLKWKKKKIIWLILSSNSFFFLILSPINKVCLSSTQINNIDTFSCHIFLLQ